MFTYLRRVAYDPDTEVFARNADFMVYDPADTGFATPLQVVTTKGALASVLSTGTLGVLPGFRHAALPLVTVRDTAGRWVWDLQAVEGALSASIMADVFADKASEFTVATDATYATKMEVTEDPARPGIYTLSPTWVTEDPARPGIYTIGV